MLIIPVTLNFFQIQRGEPYLKQKGKVSKAQAPKKLRMDPEIQRVQNIANTKQMREKEKMLQMHLQGLKEPMLLPGLGLAQEHTKNKAALGPVHLW